MKQITVYEAKDGAEFKNQEDCEKHELFINALTYATDLLHPIVNELDGEDYIQHPAGSVRAARSDVIRAIGSHLSIPDRVIVEALRADHNQTIFGRFVDDSGNRTAYSVWTRFMSMCPVTDREFSQPYYLLQSQK
jgi:hypothetical protein